MTKKRPKEYWKKCNTTETQREQHQIDIEHENLIENARSMQLNVFIYWSSGGNSLIEIYRSLYVSLIAYHY